MVRNQIFRLLIKDAGIFVINLQFLVLQKGEVKLDQFLSIRLAKSLELFFFNFQIIEDVGILAINLLFTVSTGFHGFLQSDVSSE